MQLGHSAAAVAVLLLVCCSTASAATDPCSDNFPTLGVDFYPAESKTVALTFDDAPDATNTARVLDALKNAGVKATFFVNTHNQLDVANSATGQALLKRISDEGHTVGSHTVDHISLDNLDTTRVEYELAGLEQTLTGLGIAAPKLFRAPHGTPYIRGGADLPRVAGVVRRHAVNVVWTFAGTTTLDWDCGDSVQCVLDNYETFFSGGRSGIPLMHAVIGGTAGALPQILQAGKAAGINFVSVDDFVREKYGMSAADVVSRVNANCPNTYGSGSSSSSNSSSGGGGGNGGGSNNRGGRRGGPGNPGGPGGPGGGGPGGPGDGGPGGPGDN